LVWSIPEKFGVMLEGECPTLPRDPVNCTEFDEPMEQAKLPFRFPYELIEELEGNKEFDACGVLPECYEETCPCSQLGRNGRSIDIYGGFSSPEFGFHGDPERRIFKTLTEAVEANQRYLEQLPPVPDEEREDGEPDRSA
jgi:hypothetical protein